MNILNRFFLFRELQLQVKYKNKGGGVFILPGQYELIEISVLSDNNKWVTVTDVLEDEFIEKLFLAIRKIDRGNGNRSDTIKLKSEWK